MGQNLRRDRGWLEKAYIKVRREFTPRRAGELRMFFAYEEDQVHANAVLIAVAPEMHEELNNICLMCQRGEIEVEYTSHRFHGDCGKY